MEQPITMMGSDLSLKHFPNYRKLARFDSTGKRLQGVFFDDPDVPESVILEQLAAGEFRVFVPDHIKRDVESSLRAEWPVHHGGFCRYVGEWT